MKLIPLIVTLLPIISFAVVKRNDIPDENYQKMAKEDFFAPIGRIQATKKSGTGVLISPNVVLTSAHTVFKDKKVKFILYNSLDKQTLYSGRVCPHEDFVYEVNKNNKPTFVKNDIALIFLDQAIENVKPVTLYKGNSFLEKKIYCCGFGKTGTGLKGPLIRDRKKRAFTNRIKKIKKLVGSDEYLICYFNSPKESSQVTELEGCGAQGDSGAPVFIDEANKKSVIGLLSLVSNKSKYNDFNAIIPIKSHLIWIEKKLSEETKKNSDKIGCHD